MVISALGCRDHHQEKLASAVKADRKAKAVASPVRYKKDIDGNVQFSGTE